MMKNYKLRGLFWACRYNFESKIFDVPHKYVFCETIECAEDEFCVLERATDILNKKLPNFLTANKIYRWFPIRRLTYEYYAGDEIDKEDENNEEYDRKNIIIDDLNIQDERENNISGVISICYYHDIGVHDKVYEFYESNEMVLESLFYTPFQQRMDEFYSSYNLCSESSEIFCKEDSDSPINFEDK